MRKIDFALAEANRLYGVTPTDGEHRTLVDLLAKFSAREAVDLLFGPDAKPYDAPGGLRDVLTQWAEDAAEQRFNHGVGCAIRFACA